MQKFTAIEYLMIDIANNYGYDKLTWNERIQWVMLNEIGLEDCLNPDNPILYRKAVRAYRKAQRGEPINHAVSLDSTWSGGQIMAVLMRCEKTAIASNLIYSNKRVDIYTNVKEYMNDTFIMNKSRQDIKDCLMPHFYGSKTKPKEVFGNNTPEHKAFLNTLKENLPGAERCMDIMQSTWNSDAIYHSWNRPDGTFVKCPVMVKETKRIKCNTSSFTHIMSINTPKEGGVSQAANFIQSLDGMIMACMVNMACNQGYELYGIHDSFI